MPAPATLENHLKSFNQQHLLRYWEQLDAASRAALTAEIQGIDFAELSQLVSGDDHAVDFKALAARAQPPRAVRADGSGTRWTKADALSAGEAALRSGRLAMILVAGGQGTRLGFDRPKGMFPIGPVSNRTLFQLHADRLAAVAKHYRVRIPLFIMTSPATHQDTLDYLTSNNWLGWSKDDLRLFCQGTMPAVDAKTGQVLLESQGKIALSPDGHGGMVTAFTREGCLDTCRQRGIELVFYAQVDNPLVQVCDPELIGHHLMAHSELTTQVVKKRFALERVGNVVEIDGRVQIIEYSDLPNEAAERTTADGALELWAGNIAVHVFNLDFLARAVQETDHLPFHRAQKKVPYLDEHGKLVEPTSNNAIKFERFIFDLLPFAKNGFVVEGLAEEVFAPVKNAEGAATDTASLAKQAILAQHHRWLTSAGATISPGISVEIHPSWAFDATTVAQRVKPGLRFDSDTFLRG